MSQDAVAARRAARRTSPPALSRGAAAALCLALGLGACTLHDEPPVALATPGAPVKLARAAPAPDVKTVRPSAESDEADATPTIAALPTPQQIFDFHPAGSRPDAWRQPFIIDPNDGPLAKDVRRSAEELKAFLALPKADPKADARLAARHRCGETDIATAKPGCAGPATAPAPQAATPSAVPSAAAAR